MHTHWGSLLPGQAPQQTWIEVTAHTTTLTSTSYFIFGENYTKLQFALHNVGL